ncbi:MAG: tetraacyldisaccharide 4'-kinase [Fibrobacterota bacterium]
MAPPVVVVGSLRSGGTGKTDLVAWIARRHPELAILAHPTGDEDRFLTDRFPGRVFVHRDLLVAWNKARDAGCRAAVSDGGLQDPALDGCPAICVDLETPPGASDLLPFGRYRELSPRPRARLLRISLEQDLSPRLDQSSLPPRGTQVVAACSIARPERFFQDLEQAGMVLAERVAFGDHRHFAASVVTDTLTRKPGHPWVITEKDAARGESRSITSRAWTARRILSPNVRSEEEIDSLTDSVRSSHAP